MYICAFAPHKVARITIFNTHSAEKKKSAWWGHMKCKTSKRQLLHIDDNIPNIENWNGNNVVNGNSGRNNIILNDLMKKKQSINQMERHVFVSLTETHGVSFYFLFIFLSKQAESQRTANIQPGHQPQHTRSEPSSSSCWCYKFLRTQAIFKCSYVRHDLDIYLLCYASQHQSNVLDHDGHRYRIFIYAGHLCAFSVFYT